MDVFQEDVDVEALGSSLGDLLKEYQTKRDAEVQQNQEEEEKRKETLSAPKTFNKGKVPRAMLEATRALPIFSKKEALIEVVKKNQVLIVEGDTGSGKSTQIPQYLAEAGFATTGKIGITQPRRVAAKALAERVSKECGVTVGTLVGYAVRFDKSISGDTIIKYMTDGLLVRECTTEPNLNSYSVIIVDEAHERSINTDVCFGLLKRAAKNRPDLKIIISSATLEKDKFSKFFDNAPIFTVDGRMFNVELIYEPGMLADHVQEAADTVLRIHRREPIGSGDVLVFLSGQDEIEKVWDLLEIKMSQQNIPHSELHILPCYSGLHFEEQQLIFVPAPKGARKVVLATNIAETSLTIDGIVYVVDSGYFKQNEYNPRSGINSLVLKRITKFQATQRFGRAGRTRPGKCYRLYTQSTFENLSDTTTPEIQRCNLQSVLLDLIAMGISNPLSFNFMDAPSQQTLCEALEHLMELSALDKSYKLTQLGRQMSRFPLDPPLSRVIIESRKLGCSEEALKIVALLSIQYQNLFFRNKKKRALADASRAKFNHVDGDHLSLLKVFMDWEIQEYSQQWCSDNYIQYRLLCEAEDVRIELNQILDSHNEGEPVRICTRDMVSENLRRAFTAGYFRQLAKKCLKGYSYRATNDIVASEDLFLHPASSLFPKKPPHQYIIYNEVVKTTKAFMRGVIVIEPRWVHEYAPQYVDRMIRQGVYFF